MTFASVFALYGYRLDALEARAQEVRETVNTTDQTLVQLQITTGKIETDVSYIKSQINRVFPPVH